MRRLLVTLDDDLDLWLRRQANQGEAVRNALRIYKEDITTDTVNGLRRSYELLKRQIDERMDAHDESFRRMDKLIEYIESRMM